MQGTLSRTAVGLVAVALASPLAAGQPGQSRPREQTPVIVEVRDDGFGWGAAGIGVVGGFGLALVGTTLVDRRRRTSDNKQRKGASCHAPPS
jgi:hypothetical protein